MQNKQSKKNIGLMGAVTNNDNLGCVALTISLLRMLEEISDSNNATFEYFIFEDVYNEEKMREVARILSVPFSRLHSVPNYYVELTSAKAIARSLYHTSRNKRSIDAIRSCDCVIDLTQGDSFSDIYGQRRFFLWSKYKELVLKYHVPLILGPQTYGPFMDRKVKETAKSIIEQAALVVARDTESAEFISEFADKEVVVGTDLAFHLPYNWSRHTGDLIKVGINPSGLLSANKTEETKLNSDLKTDYDAFLDRIFSYLLDSGNYEVHVIPHVGDETQAFKGRDSRLIVHSKFKNPVEAKNCISSMDVFIGSRMHATIAAISSGVATIPVAYSKKFSGLFNNIGYDNVVDLRFLTTDEAVEKTIEMIEGYTGLQEQANEAMKQAEVLYKKMQSEIERCILR